MWSIDNTVGRLIEARIVSPVTAADLPAFGGRIASLFASQRDKVIICTDLMRADTFPPAVSEGFLTIMRKDNPKVLRSAFLFQPSATFGLQIERLLKEAANPDRRAFRTVAELSAWLGEVATPDERARITAFLSARP
jgi:hypothetical protein